MYVYESENMYLEPIPVTLNMILVRKLTVVFKIEYWPFEEVLDVSLDFRLFLPVMKNCHILHAAAVT